MNKFSSILLIIVMIICNAQLHAQADFSESAGGSNIQMVFITGGEFMMGSAMSETGRYNDENLHRVRVHNFYIGKYEITQAQYLAIMGDNPSEYQECGIDCPVCNVNWSEAATFCNKLSELAGLTLFYKISESSITYNISANGYRLPTEAEWEYAARGGSDKPIYSGSITDVSTYNWPELDAIAYYGGNSCVDYEAFDCSEKEDKQLECSNCGPQPVGQKQANAYGLHDMLGNVWEWCNDYYEFYFPDMVVDEITMADVQQVNNELIENPLGPETGKMRVRRGGSWKHSARNSRCANRSNRMPNYKGSAMGFRIVRNE